LTTVSIASPPPLVKKTTRRPSALASALARL
jgi:hypothetical protein